MIEGAWIPTAAELGGRPFPAEVLNTMKLTIEGDRYTVHVGTQLDQGVIKLDTSAKPEAMLITGTDGPNKGKTFPAIFELTGDTLRICYDLAGKARPAGFTTAAGTQQFLVRYERAKP